MNTGRIRSVHISWVSCIKARVDGDLRSLRGRHFKFKVMSLCNEDLIDNPSGKQDDLNKMIGSQT